MCGLLRTVCTSRGVTAGVTADMEPGLSLARLQVMHGMPWACFHTLSRCSHSLTHAHTHTNTD